MSESGSFMSNMVGQSSKTLVQLGLCVIDFIEIHTGLFLHDGLCLTSAWGFVYVGAEATMFQDGFLENPV